MAFLNIFFKGSADSLFEPTTSCWCAPSTGRFMSTSTHTLASIMRKQALHTSAEIQCVWNLPQQTSDTWTRRSHAELHLLLLVHYSKLVGISAHLLLLLYESLWLQLGVSWWTQCTNTYTLSQSHTHTHTRSRDHAWITKWVAMK